MVSISALRRLFCLALTPIGMLAAPVCGGVAAADDSAFDVPQLFSTVCGFCHSDGGRKSGHGPQLMNTARSDDFIINRIKTGKEGAMPAFGQAFTDEQIAAIIKYIRSLKPE